MSEPMTKEDMMRWAEALREEMRAQTQTLAEQREIDAKRRAEDMANYTARMEEARRRDDRQLSATVMATLVGGALAADGYLFSNAESDFHEFASLARRIIDEGGKP